MTNSLARSRIRSSWVSSELISDFLEQAYPATGSNEALETARRHLENNFFAKNGLGGKLASDYEKIKKSLTLPKFLSEAYKKLDQGSNMDDAELQKIMEKFRTNFAEEQYFIVPSFYKLIIYLRKIKKEFGLVLRSFDHNLSQFSMEFNQWA